ncbi:nucleotidyltransferase family protein [Limibaculum sp. M0105]|uniref:Nucleotidyltransferase family protein n=1 Tax=Thermohalobaculum xanthum TaxID=2753746 RepID=A0A8J7M607_9RHOB|nr:nucleotidyltransferase family protein [Thermohalobaculum xanthum]MBK0398124.1 nucleotidyltransferase family protein [Thermohalobaculum xanthum]
MREVDEIAQRLTPRAWGRFIDLAVKRHRVAPILSGALRGVSIPGEVLEALQGAARDAGIAALRQKAETLRIVDALGSVGIRPALLKGWALAERLYGSAGMRQSRDLDLLVTDAEFDEAARELGRIGYVADFEPCSDEMALPPSARVSKDIELRLPGADFTVELHARSIAYRGWPGLDALDGGMLVQRIDQTGRTIMVPSPRGDLVFLSVHGLQHVFSRLRWLHDIATLIEGRSDAKLAEDLAAAISIDAGHFVRISALLAVLVFGSRWPSSWRRPALAERVAARLILGAIPGEGFAESGGIDAWRRVALKFLVAGTLSQRLSLLSRSKRMLFDRE